MLDMNISAFLKQLDLAQDRVMKGAIRGVGRAANELANESARLAPKDQGALVASRKVTMEVKSGVRVTATVSYSAIQRSKSGWGFDYAVFLHEAANWDPTTPGTGPKFLERPLKARYRRYQQLIAEEIRKELT